MRDDVTEMTETPVPLTMFRRRSEPFTPRGLPGRGGAAAFSPARPVAAPATPAPAPAAEPKPPKPAPPAAPPAPAITEADLAQARQIARQEGADAARAEAEADLAAARELFLRAAALLEEGAETLRRDLAADLQAAVFRLASERAGMAIDTAPAAFRDRIARLADAAGSAADALVVTLNPQDLEQIAPLIAQDAPTLAPPLARARLVAGPDLARGDAVLRGPEIAIEDRLSGAAS